MNKKLKVGILMGGPSEEHEVSLASGENVFKFMDRSRFLPTKLLLTKDFRIYEGAKLATFPAVFKKYDLIFNALHGEFGEDGTIQKVLDLLGVKYTGSGAHASFLGMDKLLSYELSLSNKLPTPKTWPMDPARYKNIRLPYIVKPRSGGSSVGVQVINSRSEAASFALATMDRPYIGQDFIGGREFTCGLLESKGKVIALPVVEIKTKSGFFDYDAKYTAGQCEEIVPARITKSQSDKIQSLALKMHKVVGARGYSRTDFIMKDNKMHVLEINTLPGLTTNSLLPKAAMAAGVDFKELISGIIDSSDRG